MSENMPVNTSDSSTSAANLKELPAVARNISLPCKKCGVERFHVVVAHTTPTSAKVKCEVCGSQKTFRLKTEAVRKSSSTGVKRVGTKSRKAPDVGAIWNDLKSQIGTDKLVPYNMKTKFSLANAINHPKFGVGFVTSASHDKIEVAFLEGGRSLVHNRP
jgi:hypothetical protein